MVATKSIISSSILLAGLALASPHIRRDDCDDVPPTTETVYVHTFLGDAALLPTPTGQSPVIRPGMFLIQEAEEEDVQGASIEGQGTTTNGNTDRLPGKNSNGTLGGTTSSNGLESSPDNTNISNGFIVVLGHEDVEEPLTISGPVPGPGTTTAPQDLDLDLDETASLSPSSSPSPSPSLSPFSNGRHLLNDNSTGLASNSTNLANLTNPVAPSNGSYRSVLYFTNWGIYDADHQPSDIPADKVTHLLYSFADIEQDGEVVSSDSWADVEKRYETDSWSDTGDNAYGCVKQLFLQKKRNRHLKLLLSVGGATLSPKFTPVAATAQGRRRFASSAVALIRDWGFDGIDIDWEYPQDDGEAADFVALLAEVRAELDAHAEEHAAATGRDEVYRFQLTIAVPAGESNYKRLRMREMAPLLDGWHLMAYDYTGPWESRAGHQANLYPATGEDNEGSNAASTPADTDSALRYYLDAGVDPRKIMLGLPLYGRSFADTDGLGQPFDSLGGGSDQDGVWRYSDLPRPGAEVFWDGDVVASWSYDAESRELVSFDDVRAAEAKAGYLKHKGLGGAIFWESSGDKTGDESIVGTLARELARLESDENLLDYPRSRYDNIRSGLSREE